MNYPDNFDRDALDRFWGGNSRAVNDVTLDEMFAEIDRCKQRLETLAETLPGEAKAEGMKAASALDDVADDFLKPARSLLASMEQEPVS